MNKSELSSLIASKTGFLTKDTLFIIDLILTTMRDGLCKDGRLELRGLGSFEVRERAPRKGRIMATGEMVDIPSHKTVVFIPGKSFKNKNKRL